MTIWDAIGDEAYATLGLAAGPHSDDTTMAKDVAALVSDEEHYLLTAKSLKYWNR